MVLEPRVDPSLFQDCEAQTRVPATAADGDGMGCDAMRSWADETLENNAPDGTAQYSTVSGSGTKRISA